MRKRRLMTAIAGVSALCLALGGCSGKKDSSDTSSKTEATATENSAAAEENSEKSAEAAASVEFEEADISKVDCTIKLKGSSADIDGDGASFEGGVLSITAEGCYEISGELTDGRIEVNASNEDKVQIIFNGVDVTCSDNAPFIVWQADKTLIHLKEGTTNTFTDGGTYYTGEESDDEEVASAAFFSKDDLGFSGEGTLTVKADCNDGIAGKDDVWFCSGTYEVTAADDAIIGKDSVAIKDGQFSLEAEGDGIKATKTEDSEKGFVTILGGSFDIISACDAIQAETYVLVEDGTLDLMTGGGAGEAAQSTEMMGRGGFGGQNQSQSSSDTDSSSNKGLKAGIDVTVNGGTITMDCADDTIHSGDSVNINGGTLTMKSGDDGIHGDATVVLAGGEITIEQSYEGVEAETITVTGGDISVTSSDDGFNAANADSAEGSMDDRAGMGMGGQPGGESSGTGSLIITGGDLYVNAGGDGLDSNGSIAMSGGNVFVDGPTNDGNGTLDYNSTFEITGGTLIGVGSSGMMQGFTDGSTQAGFAVALDASQQAGAKVVVKDSSGTEVASFTAAKTFNAVILSNDKIKTGETYDIEINGNTVTSVEMDSTVVQIGGEGMGGGMPGGGQGGRMGGRSDMGGQNGQDFSNGEGMTPPDMRGDMGQQGDMNGQNGQNFQGGRGGRGNGQMKGNSGMRGQNDAGSQNDGSGQLEVR